MNFLELFNKALLELNYRPLSRVSVSSGNNANDFERIFKTEHLRVLENLKRVNAEVCSSADWGFLQEKTYSAQGPDGALKENLEGPDDLSLIPRGYGDVLVYGAVLKTKATPSHPKFAFWNASYTRALTRMRAECKDDIRDVPRISVGKPRAAETFYKCRSRSDAGDTG